MIQIDKEFWNQLVDVMREAMEVEVKQTRRKAADLVTRYRGKHDWPSDLVSRAEEIIELQEEGQDDRPGR